MVRVDRRVAPAPWAERRRQLTAPAFLTLGATNYEEQDKKQLKFDIIDEQLDTMGKALLGMTLGCARCHDHKFDPIPQRDYYAMAGIFRSVRFGAASAHGRANMIRFNFFRKAGAFERTQDGKYRVVPEKFGEAAEELAGMLLRLQGDGDYAGARRLIETLGVIEPQLQADLERLRVKGIPVDVVFEQGTDVLGL